MRHGKSDWDDPTLTDRQRPLNARGRRDVPEMAERLRSLDIRPSLIVASPAVRTWETAKAVADVFGYPREFMHREEDLYLASAKTISSVIGAQDASFNAMIVCGHNPGITQLANELVPGLTGNLVTSGTVTVRADAKDWVVLVASPVELVNYDFPKNRR